MKPLHRRLIILAILIIALTGAYLVYDLLAARRPGGVPSEFTEARARGGVVSQEIVLKSNEVAAAIAQLSGSTSTYAQASSTIDGILSRVEEIRIQALQLAEELNTMGGTLADIRSVEAREAAFDSVYYQVNLVEGLVRYTQRVAQLTMALRLNLESGVQNDAEIAELVKEINEEIADINDFNAEAAQAMEKFEVLVR